MTSSILSPVIGVIRGNRLEFLLAFLTLLIFLINFFDFPFQGDPYYSYIGKEILRGAPVFSTTIGVKPPVAYFLNALFMAILSFLPNHIAIRTGMLMVACLTSVLFYKVIKEVTDDTTTAVITVMMSLSFIYYIQDTLNSGLKSIILLFLFTEFTLLFKKRYALSGLFAGLSFMTWQPAGVLICGPLSYAYLNKESMRKYLEVMIGFLLPVLIVSGYFAYHGLLYRFIDYTTFKPLQENIDRFELFKWIRFMGIFGYYNTELMFFGLAALGAIIIIKDFWIGLRTNGTDVAIRNKEAFAFTLPFVMLLLYSVFDFQGSDDVIILMPIIVSSAAVFLRYSQKWFPLTLIVAFIVLYGYGPYLQPVHPENPLITASKEARSIDDLMVVKDQFSVFELIYYSAFHRKGEEMTMNDQLEIAEYIRANTEHEEEIFSLGAPEILILSERRNVCEVSYETDRFCSSYHTAGYDKWVDLDWYRDVILKKRPRFIVSRNVPMNDRVIDNLNLKQEIENNYVVLDSFNPEYVVWERV